MAISEMWKFQPIPNNRFDWDEMCDMWQILPVTLEAYSSHAVLSYKISWMSEWMK